MRPHAAVALPRRHPVLVATVAVLTVLGLAFGPLAPPQAAAQTVGSGLHYTPQELEVWRERAAQGPYRTGDEVSEQSPGDWTRIIENRDDFLASPGAQRWAPDWGDGPIPTTSGDRRYVPDPDYTNRVRDAAFAALVTEDAAVADAVVDELLTQAREPRADLGNRARFPNDQGRVRDTNPYFMTAAALTTLLFASDYVNAWASAEERAELRAWHRDGADWLYPDMRRLADAKFRDRAIGDYTPRLDPNDGKAGFFGGPPTTAYGRVYNNRAGVIWLYISLVGIDQDVGEFTDQSKQWYQEWIRFSIYPASGSYAGRRWSGGGWMAEMERATENGSAGPDLGWHYSLNMLTGMGMMADHFARAGDPSLYEYKTREGLYGTEVPADQEPKSLLFALREMSRHTNGEIRRYGTSQSGYDGDPDYLIDGYNPMTGWNGLRDVPIAVMNLHYDDSLLRQAYLRDGPGFRPYTSQPAPDARGEPWLGIWGMYPGVLFQAGLLEGVVDPYGEDPSSGGEEQGPSDATETSSTVIEPT